jgi:hypothetical protein
MKSLRQDMFARHEGIYLVYKLAIDQHVLHTAVLASHVPASASPRCSKGIAWVRLGSSSASILTVISFGGYRALLRLMVERVCSNFSLFLVMPNGFGSLDSPTSPLQVLSGFSGEPKHQRHEPASVHCRTPETPIKIDEPHLLSCSDAMIYEAENKPTNTCGACIE